MRCSWKGDTGEEAFDFQFLEVRAVDTCELPNVYVCLVAISERDAKHFEVREHDNHWVGEGGDMLVYAESKFLEVFPTIKAFIETLNALWDIAVDCQDTKRAVRALVPDLKLLRIPVSKDGSVFAPVENEVLPEQGCRDKEFTPAMADIGEPHERLWLIVDGKLEDLGSQLRERFEARHKVTILILIL